MAAFVGDGSLANTLCNRLKNDILKEAARYGGLILVQEEIRELPSRRNERAPR